MSKVKSAADIVAEMVGAMKVLDPEVDTSIGTVLRKIIDVTGEQIAPAYAMAYLQDWIYDIDTKEGASLDDYVNQFGLFRIPARRATGLVTFSRPKPAPANVPIPSNIFVITGTTPRIAFTTISSGFILKSTTSVTIPVQAVLAGSSGNLPVGSISNLASTVPGVQNTVVQAGATTGGTDAETDEALRERFRKTVFRNLAGTEDMFLGLALEDATPDDDFDETAVHAVVIGPTSRWREQIQIVAGSGTSAIPETNSSYIYEGSSALGQDLDSGAILTEGVHYAFDTSVNPPVVSTIEDNLGDDTVYELDFEYVSSASRNDPNAGITNRVDIWVSGINPEAAAETTYFQPADFSASTDDPMFYGNFVRASKTASSETAAPTSKFLQLAWGPIVEFPDVLTINGDTYENEVDYWVVHDETAAGLSPHSLFGLEFVTGSIPAPNSQIVLSGAEGTGYFYNRLPSDIENRAKRWKLVASDLMVHQARYVRLIFNFAVMYSSSYERGAVQSQVDNAISTWLNTQGFQSTLQVSDILQVAHNVQGVDNIRFLVDGEQAVFDDDDTWGIQVVNPLGIHISNIGTTRPIDRVFEDNQIPVVYDIRYLTKAQNSFEAI